MSLSMPGNIHQHLKLNGNAAAHHLSESGYAGFRSAMRSTIIAGFFQIGRLRSPHGTALVGRRRCVNGSCLCTYAPNAKFAYRPRGAITRPTRPVGTPHLVRFVGFNSIR
jgi:hypothetical protein